ncbi:MAG: hypothetical protein NT076_04800 [Candidatus Pacearchaeota archaeon]|nr:hypothetical protein [Candidatus Pacearchaeota archaeon]
MKRKKEKKLAMLAPSFASEFDYPEIIGMLKNLGFDKVVELTFGAKMVNREYHKLLENSKELVITSVCPGIVSLIEGKFSKYKKNLAKIDSPMIATAKICKKVFPKHRLIFISPCNFKKIEAKKSKLIDGVIDYQELKQIFDKKRIKPKKGMWKFDRFYNDYTKVYPLPGGLSRTANLNGIVGFNECMIIDGAKEVENFLNKPDKSIKFLDVTFCKGGCIGGPFLSKTKSLGEKQRGVLKYINLAKKERISRGSKGEIKEANGIDFRK